jgi:hypothetical protein
VAGVPVEKLLVALAPVVREIWVAISVQPAAAQPESHDGAGGRECDVKQRRERRHGEIEEIMKDESKIAGLSAAGGADIDALPAVVDRATWQAELDALRVREKAHTRDGDAIAAARRRLPIVEVDPAITLSGPHGPVTLLEVFEGRRQLIAYFHMWYTGKPAEAQCEGCTFYNGQVRELSYLHSRDVTYATFCQGPFNESVRYRDFMGWDVPWYSV